MRRCGKVGCRRGEAEMISAVAVHDPSAQTELLAVAGHGFRALQDACVAARARTEDQAARAKRQHVARSLSMWNNVDGMLEGHFRLTPEVGGRLKTAIEEHAKRVFRSKWREGVRDRSDAYAADALAALVLGEPDAGQAAAEPAGDAEKARRDREEDSGLHDAHRDRPGGAGAGVRVGG